MPTMTHKDWRDLEDLCEEMKEAGLSPLAELIWDQTPKYAPFKEIMEQGRRYLTLRRREGIQHQLLNRLGAPKTASGIHPAEGGALLNINGRLEGWLKAHPLHDSQTYRLERR